MIIPDNLPFTHHRHDRSWLEDQLKKLPKEVCQVVSSEYERLYCSESVESVGRRLANNYLLDAVNVLKPNYEGSTNDHDYCSDLAAKMLIVLPPETVFTWVRSFGVSLPKVRQDDDPTAKHSLESLKKRIMSPEWWARQFTKLKRKNTEQRERNAGNVSTNASLYVSKSTLVTYQEQLKKQESWKKQALLISNEGDEVSLDATEHKHSKEFVQFAEFMVRVKGLASIAQDHYISANAISKLPEKIKRGEGGSFSDLDYLEPLKKYKGLVGIAFTLTVPSRFHRFTQHKGRLVRNRHYDSTKTPSDARDWLQETWKLTQTAWKRKTKHIEPINGFGFRVDEAHHDGVGHYHYAMWIEAKDAYRAAKLFYSKALRGQYTDRVQQQKRCQYGQAQDATERGAFERRLNFKVMDSANGMVGYMVKYITKGFLGKHEDFSKPSVVDDLLVNLAARRSVWGLRQFSFFNAASVTVWRELRRLDSPFLGFDATTIKAWSPVVLASGWSLDWHGCGLMAQAWQKAKSEDWEGYTQLNGGMYCSARQRPVKAWRVAKKSTEGGAVFNAYGEAVEYLRGLTVHDVCKQTRFKEWYLLSLTSLHKKLIDQYVMLAGIKRDEVPVQFSDDIQAVIQKAKRANKVKRLANHAGVVMFESQGVIPSLEASASLGLVGTCWNNFPQSQ